MTGERLQITFEMEHYDSAVTMKKLKQKKIWAVYYLLDPRNGEIPKEGEHIYIGETENAVRRYRVHINECLKYGKDHKTNWIRTLLEQDLFPEMSIRCLVETRDEAWRIERILIKKLKERLVKVTNTKESGSGWPKPGWHHTEEARKKIGKASIGNTRSAGFKNALGHLHSEDAREVMRQAKLGTKFSEERCIAHGESHVIPAIERFERSEEIEKQREITTNNWKNEEYRNKITKSLESNWLLRQNPTEDYFTTRIQKAQKTLDRRSRLLSKNPSHAGLQLKVAKSLSILEGYLRRFESFKNGKDSIIGTRKDPKEERENRIKAQKLRRYPTVEYLEEKLKKNIKTLERLQRYTNIDQKLELRIQKTKLTIERYTLKIQKLKQEGINAL